ncbi:MAG: hypothetical protein ACLU80_10640 [Dorea sp.]
MENRLIMAMKVTEYPLSFTKKRMNRICLCLTMGELFESQQYGKSISSIVLWTTGGCKNSHYSEKFSG